MPREGLCDVWSVSDDGPRKPMYDACFGLTAAPFRISPDTSFYFDSHAHREALDVLRRSLAADAEFTVLSGDIGAGKTTIVRKLLEERSPALGPVVSVCSSQLSADDLLGSTAAGLGVAGALGDAAEARRGLEQLFKSLSTQDQRALLVIDEAQHLLPDALSLLRSLARHRPKSKLRMQTLLVGQGSLHHLISTQAGGSAAPAIGAAHHLRPLEQAETQQYIHHRLRCVGWTGRPGLTDDAAAEIYRRSGGVPRRINQLCGRLLLACELGTNPTIDAALVARTATELQAELAGFDNLVAPAPATPPRPASRRQPAPLLCLVASVDDQLRATALLRALGARDDLPPAQLLRLDDDDTDPGLVEALRRIGPVALIVFGGSSSRADACLRSARSLGIPIIGIGMGGLDDAATGAPASLDRLSAAFESADLHYAVDSSAAVRLRLSGVAAAQVICVGDVRVDAVRQALQVGGVDWSDTAAGGRLGPAVGAQQGYGLVVLEHLEQLHDDQLLTGQVALLREISRDIALLWPFDKSLAERLAALDLQRAIDKERIVCMPAQTFTTFIQLLRTARCVLTDSLAVEQAAKVLGTPCARLSAASVPVAGRGHGRDGASLYRATRDIWTLLFNGAPTAELPAQCDGCAAERIAADLAIRPFLQAHHARA